MPDIVERLREGPPTPELIEEAAVMIERLRFLLVKGSPSVNASIEALKRLAAAKNPP